MTIQDGDINKHLDNKPPKDKVFIWSLIIVIIIIAILLVILFKPEIFTNILDKFIPEDDGNVVVVDDKDDKEKEEPSIISDDTEYINIAKGEADEYYGIAYHMSEYLKDKEYLFTNEAINGEYESIWTKEKENFPIWFALNEEYEKSISLRSVPESTPISAKTFYNGVEYKKTSRYFKEEDLKEAFYKLYSVDYTYPKEDVIGYHGCYIAIYSENLEGYVIYQCVKACKGTLYSVNYNLIKAEVAENYLYLYEKDLETGDIYMYTLVYESDSYKFLSRQKVTYEKKPIPQEEEQNKEDILVYDIFERIIG